MASQSKGVKKGDNWHVANEQRSETNRIPIYAQNYLVSAVYNFVQSTKEHQCREHTVTQRIEHNTRRYKLT